MRKFRILLLLALVVSVLMVTSVAMAQDPVELRITWYDDGNEGEVLRDLLDQFEAENEDITVVIDTIAYTEILNQLPIQVEAGEGPDMARVTNLPGLIGYYLDLRPLLADPDYFEASFPANVLGSMRGEGDETGLYGFPNQFTVTGPFINLTLFEQAGVEVPADDASWEEWTEAARLVAEATDTSYAIAMDRSGHRLAGPALSMGASFFDEDGNVTVDSEGLRAMAEILKMWHDEGLTNAEVWLGSGGNYAAAADFFIQGQLVFYMAGSWQIGRFTADIGDTFDWVAVPNPTGPGGSTAMPGGSALVAFADTEYPEEVARVMEFLVQQDVYREFTERTLFIPGHLDLGEVNFDTESELAQNALGAFSAQVANIQEQAYMLQAHPHNTIIFNSIRDRLTQWMVGELTLDEALERAQQEVDEAIAAEAES